MDFKKIIDDFYKWDTKLNATDPWEARLRWTFCGVVLAVVLHWLRIL
jgi:hypothetical protein